MMLKNTSCLSSRLVQAKAGANADAVDDAADAVDAVDAADAACVGDATDADDAEKQIRPVILSCLGKGWC